MQIPHVNQTLGDTLRGTTTGEIKINAETDYQKCCIVCTTWSKWLPFLSTLRLSLVWLCCLNSAMVDISRQLSLLPKNVPVYNSILDAVGAPPNSLLFIEGGTKLYLPPTLWSSFCCVLARGDFQQPPPVDGPARLLLFHMLMWVEPLRQLPLFACGTPSNRETNSTHRQQCCCGKYHQIC